jgi:hypothetical protein
MHHRLERVGRQLVLGQEGVETDGGIDAAGCGIAAAAHAGQELQQPKGHLHRWGVGRAARKGWVRVEAPKKRSRHPVGLQVGWAVS